MSRSTRFLFLATAAVGILSLSACAPPPPTGHAPEPSPCTDSLYVSLKRQHPDSLSERAWQRLEALDRECATARTQAAHADQGGMMAGGMHGGRKWGLLGMVTVAAMLAMMSAIW